jgi:hypothetical protein
LIEITNIRLGSDFNGALVSPDGQIPSGLLDDIFTFIFETVNELLGSSEAK